MTVSISLPSVRRAVPARVSWATVIEQNVGSARTPILVFLAKTGFTLEHFGKAMKTLTTLLQEQPLTRMKPAGAGKPNPLLTLIAGLRAAYNSLTRQRTGSGVLPSWEGFYARVMEPVLRRKSLPEPFSWERVGRDQWRVVEAYDSEQEIGPLFKAATAANDTTWVLKPGHPLLKVAGGSGVQRTGTIQQVPGTAQYRIQITASARLKALAWPKTALVPIPALKDTVHALVQPATPPIEVSPTRRMTRADGKPIYQETIEMLVRLG